MSKKILLLLCFVVFLCLPINAFTEEGYKISGSGYNYPEPGVRGSMGLNVISTSLGGWLRYYYPNMNLISTSITGMTVDGDTVTITGEGTVQGDPGYTFTATIIDSKPDATGLEIYNSDGTLYYHAETKKLLKGNFIISAQ